MHNRQEHQQEVRNFLHKNLSIYDWRFSFPHGSGRESYIAHGFKRDFFVKVDISIDRYLAMAKVGLTPPVFVYGQLESGLSVIVQQFVTGKNPSRGDYRERMKDVAKIVREMHADPRIREVLPAAPTDSFMDAAARALRHLQEKWARYKAQVSNVADFVDSSLEQLSQQVNMITGAGLVAAHGDICNANWLFDSKGNIYILDFDSMSMDDPALDMGALLWWYYPPEVRQSFLDIAGYPYDDEFKFRMQVRMAMHCLNILLPRDGSFDTFSPEHFGESLQDFRAVMEGNENPQGYND